VPCLDFPGRGFNLFPTPPTTEMLRMMFLLLQHSVKEIAPEMKGPYLCQSDASYMKVGNHCFTTTPANTNLNSVYAVAGDFELFLLPGFQACRCVELNSLCSSKTRL
jgi:hypothetical protein